MKIGLVDSDLLIIPQLKTLNVELMKLGVYFENNGHQVEVLHKENNPYDYDKLIIFASACHPMKKFLSHPDIDFYGDYYSNKIYMPFNEEEIDYNTVNYKIYDNLLKQNFLKKVYNEKDIKMFKNSKWVRLYPNEKPIDINELLTGETVKIVDNYIFNRKDWHEVIRRMAIYPSQIYFLRPQLIKNTQDLKDFIYMVDYGFVGLKGVVLITDYDEFEKFVLDNKDLLKKYQNKINYNIGYNSNNLYTETFYLSQLIPIMKRAELLSKMGIEGYKTDMVLYSGRTLTKAVYFALMEWFDSDTANKMPFQLYFLHIKYKKDEEIKRLYKNFIKNRPEYGHWFNKMINGGED